MLPRLEDPNFIGAAQNCGFCRDYCESKMIASDNVYRRQTRIFLQAIQNSAIAKNAEETCRQCDFKSARVARLLEPYGIRV